MIYKFKSAISTLLIVSLTMPLFAFDYAFNARSDLLIEQPLKEIFPTTMSRVQRSHWANLEFMRMKKLSDKFYKVVQDYKNNIETSETKLFKELLNGKAPSTNQAQKDALFLNFSEEKNEYLNLLTNSFKNYMHNENCKILLENTTKLSNQIEDVLKKAKQKFVNEIDHARFEGRFATLFKLQKLNIGIFLSNLEGGLIQDKDLRSVLKFFSNSENITCTEFDETLRKNINDKAITLLNNEASLSNTLFGLPGYNRHAKLESDSRKLIAKGEISEAYADGLLEAKEAVSFILFDLALPIAAFTLPIKILSHLNKIQKISKMSLWVLSTTFITLTHGYASYSAVKLSQVSGELYEKYQIQNEISKEKLAIVEQVQNYISNLTDLDIKDNRIDHQVLLNNYKAYFEPVDKILDNYFCRMEAENSNDIRDAYKCFTKKEINNAVCFLNKNCKKMDHPLNLKTASVFNVSLEIKKRMLKDMSELVALKDEEQKMQEYVTNFLKDFNNALLIHSPDELDYYRLKEIEIELLPFIRKLLPEKDQLFNGV
jgi:hypothetical protein